MAWFTEKERIRIYMHKNINESSFRPFKRHFFWPMAGVVIVLVVVADVAIFISSVNSLMKTKQQDLQTIATAVAAKIPFDIHESLTLPEQQKSDQYKMIETYFQSVMDGNPEIDDIYTLRPTTAPHIYSFVVSGMVTTDANGDGKIDESEQKPALGDTYDANQSPAMEAGLVNASHDAEITYDKWGAWLSGYAPLRDSHGKGVAVVGVDYSARVINSYKSTMLNVLLLLDVIFIPFGILIVYLLSIYFSKPFRSLAHSMSAVAHGDFTQRLPQKKGEEGVFNDLFNNMQTMFEHSLEHKKHKEAETKAITIDDDQSG
jgi:methyl-accepting chemotaxis protein